MVPDGLELSALVTVIVLILGWRGCLHPIRRVALDSTGALLIADDVGNVVWRVSAAAPPSNGTPS